ncbi:hypothetical protein BLA18110_07935 [Burkholderia lata]|uniref:hypothetical protein n=1 Tax=Burkholderia lata (strain ATCC 17760 / DSM 23089 / LMG 22485 / NCIMB 9086 / R18194 / 383) TaxID=482957 RepID=UPI0014536C33|nr:hypothetical protein [Burkholderia lata]VWD54279.1 hypothetical protein BLA18110_07935 [Burkholderia lata]
MKMIEDDFDDQQKACQPRANPVVAVARHHYWLGPWGDAIAVSDLWPWAQEQVRRVNSLDDVRAQITVLSAEVTALQARKAATDASRVSGATGGLNFYSALALKSARLRVHILQVALRHLEILERHQLGEALDAEESKQVSVSSPSWEIWQSFISGPSAEKADLPSEEPLAQELVDAGLLCDAYAAIGASLIRYVTSSIAMRMQRGFFFKEIARPFVHDYLETLCKAAASVRTLVARWLLDGPSETGSAAAIAKRLNPLGAPPHLA